MKVVDLQAPDPQLLKKLGVYLAESGDWGKALAFFERTVAARKDAKPAAEDVVLWMEMGRLYYLTEQYAKAAASFTQVFDALDHPDRFGLSDSIKKALLAEPGPTFGLVGDAYLLAGDGPKAVAAYEKSHKLVPNRGLLGFRLAKVDLKAGKPAEALARLQAYFDEHRSSEETAPYQLLADILKALKKDGELIDRLEKLRAADPKNVWAGYFLAGKYFEAQRLDKAEVLYRDLFREEALVGRLPQSGGDLPQAAALRRSAEGAGRCCREPRLARRADGQQAAAGRRTRNLSAASSSLRAAGSPRMRNRSPTTFAWRPPWWRPTPSNGTRPRRCSTWRSAPGPTMPPSC